MSVHSFPDFLSQSVGGLEMRLTFEYMRQPPKVIHNMLLLQQPFAHILVFILPHKQHQSHTKLVALFCLLFATLTPLWL